MWCSPACVLFFLKNVKAISCSCLFNVFELGGGGLDRCLLLKTQFLRVMTAVAASISIILQNWKDRNLPSFLCFLTFWACDLQVSFFTDLLWIPGPLAGRESRKTTGGFHKMQVSYIQQKRGTGTGNFVVTKWVHLKHYRLKTGGPFF